MQAAEIDHRGNKTERCAATKTLTSVLAVLAESLHWERIARQMSIHVPVELQVRYRDLTRLAAVSGLNIQQMLPAE